MRIAVFGYSELTRHCIHALKLLGAELWLFCPRGDSALFERALMDRLDLPVLWFDQFADPELTDSLDDFAPQCVLSVIFNHRLPESVLNRSRIASLNIHPAPLPGFRTASPWFWPIREGLRDSSICIHHMTSTFDQGPIVLRHRLALSPYETQGLYAKRLNSAAPALMEQLYRLLQSTPFPQGEPQQHGTRFPPVCRDDILLDFSRPVADIEALVRACNPFHTAGTLFRGRALGVHEAECIPGATGKAGATLVSNGELLVNAADGRVRLSLVDPPGEGIFTGARFVELYQVASDERMGHGA